MGIEENGSKDQAKDQETRMEEKELQPFACVFRSCYLQEAEVLLHFIYETNQASPPLAPKDELKPSLRV